MIIQGHDVVEHPDGRCVISKNGKVLSEQPTTVAACEWIKSSTAQLEFCITEVRKLLVLQLEWRAEHDTHYGDKGGHTRYVIGPYIDAAAGFYARYWGIDDSLDQDDDGRYVGGRHDTLEAAKTACEHHHAKLHQNSTSSTLDEEYYAGLTIRLVRGLFCSCGYELRASDVRRDDDGTRLTCRQCQRDILVMD